MFGFIRPVKPELRMREVERFQAVYCGLCHTIRERYGHLHTLSLSYDMTFLALVLGSLEPDEPMVLRRRCAASPARPKLVCQPGEGMVRAADFSVLLTWHKLGDTLLDEHGAKYLAAKTMRALLKPGYDKACARLPEENTVIAACLAELYALEQAKTPSIDQPADAFARALVMAVPHMDEMTMRILRQMFYHTGRWVYLIDACADLAEDWQAGAYNPVALRFQLETPSLAPVREDMEITLQRSLADIYYAFQLLDVRRDQGLLENIIRLGLPLVTQQVLDGTYQSNGGQNRHGSL